jgi:hypothetical protein
VNQQSEKGKMKLKTEAKPSSRKNVRYFGRAAEFLKILCLVGSLMLVASLVPGCATPQPTAETQDILLSSGFKVVKAVTPAQETHLKSLPRGRVTVVNHKGKTWYVFPDATHNQIYVGNSNQYQSFQLTYQDEQLTNSEVGNVNMAEDSAEWGAWDALGVWGGPY